MAADHSVQRAIPEYCALCAPLATSNKCVVMALTTFHSLIVLCTGTRQVVLHSTCVCCPSHVRGVCLCPDLRLERASLAVPEVCPVSNDRQGHVDDRVHLAAHCPRRHIWRAVRVALHGATRADEGRYLHAADHSEREQRVQYPLAPDFSNLLDVMKVFMVDIITVTKANCAARMDYYQQLLLTLMVFKTVLAVVLLLAWLVPRVQHWRRRLHHDARKRPLAVLTQRRSTSPAHSSSSSTSTADSDRPRPLPPTARRRRSSLIQATRQIITKTEWAKVFRVESMVLFIAYPSVSIKIFRLFNCVSVAGQYYLVDDMRLLCYTRQWWGYAIYGGVMIVLHAAMVGLCHLRRCHDRAVRRWLARDHTVFVVRPAASTVRAGQ